MAVVLQSLYVIQLQPLTLSASSFQVDSPQGTVVGNILGTSIGSTIAFNSLVPPGALQIVGTSLQVGPTPSGTPGTVTFNLVETMLGATNTPNISYGFSVSELAAIPVNTAVPTITGTPQVGQTLTASTGTWTNIPTSYTYQWASSSGGAISGATAASYTPTTADVGNTLTVYVVATNASGSSVPVPSASTSAVAVGVPVNTVPPTISGTPQVGQTLTATSGAWTNLPTSFAYQWNRARTAILGAIASTYVPVAGDIRNTLTVSVIATNATGSSAPAISAATGVVAAAAAGQYPTLLNGYVLRPAFQVAGVDYAVGVPAGTVLTDWQALSGPGITVRADVSPPYVRVDDTSNVVISGVDFSLHGGAYLYFVNCPNLTVVNSNFGGVNMLSTPASVIQGDAASSNLTITHCSIDGAGDLLGPGTGPGESGLINHQGGGTTTLTYNWLKNGTQHVLESNQQTAIKSNIVYKNNLVEQFGFDLGSHVNYLEYAYGDMDSVDVEYNTFYNTPHGANGGEALQWYGQGGYIHQCTWAFNVMIATGGAPGTANSVMMHGGDPSTGNIGSGHDNYIDLTAAYFMYYPNVMTGWKLWNIFDMTTGALIPNPPEAMQGP
ncbi:MAG: hypothetical protein ACREBQ_01205 [Nitrososphaerales archaeon]